MANLDLGSNLELELPHNIALISFVKHSRNLALQVPFLLMLIARRNRRIAFDFLKERYGRLCKDGEGRSVPASSSALFGENRVFRTQGTGRDAKTLTVEIRKNRFRMSR